MEKLGTELQSYFTGRGTLQFTPDKPIPDDVIHQIIAIRRDEIAGG
jgi:hypothetical protein